MKRHLLLIAFLAGVLLTACASAAGETVALAPRSALPAPVLEAPASVQEAYQFALANQDVLSQIPCYCGCGGMGHTSNLACYVAEVGSDGETTFDYHALG